MYLLVTYHLGIVKNISQPLFVERAEEVWDCHKSRTNIPYYTYLAMYLFIFIKMRKCSIDTKN